MKIEVPIGDVFDKVSILEIKSSKCKNKNKLDNINKELIYLQQQCSQFTKRDDSLDILYLRLKQINQKLWDIEDEIRVKEHKQEFDHKFIELARLVYITNDERASVKKQINILLNSNLIEEKIYK